MVFIFLLFTTLISPLDSGKHGRGTTLVLDYWQHIILRVHKWCRKHLLVGSNLDERCVSPIGSLSSHINHQICGLHSPATLTFEIFVSSLVQGYLFQNCIASIQNDYFGRLLKEYSWRRRVKSSPLVYIEDPYRQEFQ